MNDSSNNHEDTQKIEKATHTVDTDSKENQSNGTDPKPETNHETESSTEKIEQPAADKEEAKENHETVAAEKHDDQPQTADDKTQISPDNKEEHAAGQKEEEDKEKKENLETVASEKHDDQPQTSEDKTHIVEEEKKSNEPTHSNSETHTEKEPAANHQPTPTKEETKAKTEKPEQQSENPNPPKKRPSTDTVKPMEKQELLSENVFKVFADAVLQRKKSSYDKFHIWEQQRTVKINSYRSICENIFERLLSKTAASIEGTEGIIRFFTDRKNQEELYYTAVTRNLMPLGNLFSDKTLKDGADWSLPKLLREYDEYHLRQTKNAQEIAGFIQKTILKDILLDMQRESVKKLNSLKDRISEARKRVNTINERTAKKGVKYSQLVSQLLKTQYKNTKQKDLYNKELSIIASSQIQTETHREFGKEVVNVWKSAEHIETARFNNVKHALSAYVDKIGHVYGPSYGDPHNVKKLLAAFEVENEVKSVFSALSLLTFEEVKFLKNEIGLSEKDELLTEHVQKYLENFPFEPPVSKPLVLKEWEAQKESGTLKSFRPCSVVVTVDGNLLLVDRADERVFKKADSVIRLHQITVKDNPAKKNPLIVDFIETIPGFILDSKNKYVIKFNSMDQVDEFLHYLTNYQN